MYSDPTPCGELEWAYELLEQAAREERKRKCQEYGHSKRIEITSYVDLPGTVFLCNFCGETFREDVNA